MFTLLYCWQKECKEFLLLLLTPTFFTLYCGDKRLTEGVLRGDKGKNEKRKKVESHSERKINIIIVSLQFAQSFTDIC